MKELLLRELFRNADQYADQEVIVKGWVRNNRNSNKFGFIELNDGSFFKSVQVVYEEEFIDNFEEISKAYVATALAVRGIVTLTPNAKQPFEIKAKEIVVEATSTPDYPLQPKRHSMEFLREIAHLRPRSNTFAAVFRVRSLVAYACLLYTSFSNSLTLPGQSYKVIIFIASSEKCFGSISYFRQKSTRIELAMPAMSCFLSRNGGSLMGNTLIL